MLDIYPEEGLLSIFILTFFPGSSLSLSLCCSDFSTSNKSRHKRAEAFFSFFQLKSFRHALYQDGREIFKKMPQEYARRRLRHLLYVGTRASIRLRNGYWRGHDCTSSWQSPNQKVYTTLAYEAHASFFVQIECHDPAASFLRLLGVSISRRRRLIRTPQHLSSAASEQVRRKRKGKTSPRFSTLLLSNVSGVFLFLPLTKEKKRKKQVPFTF